jgi:hypothetical protein
MHFKEYAELRPAEQGNPRLWRLGSRLAIKIGQSPSKEAQIRDKQAPLSAHQQPQKIFEKP